MNYIKRIQDDHCKEDLGSKEKASDYIVFEDEKSLETKVTFKKAASSILIRPVCPQRLTVTRFNRDDEAALYPRDSSVIVDFNKKIADECKDAVTVAISGLEEGSNASDYFLSPAISNNEITLLTKYTDTHAESDLIPVVQNGSKVISVLLSANRIYYINNDYLEPVKVYLEKEIGLR